MKVIFLVRYTRMGASSRLRTYQFVDHYRRAGMQCTVSPFFGDRYLNQLYSKKAHNPWLVIVAFVRRLVVLAGIFRYNRVFVEKEIFPFFPAWPEWILRITGKGYIVDYDDAVFHGYDKHPRSLVRYFLSDKISKVMKYASVVVAGNDYIAAKARESGSSSVVVIPTVVDMERYVSGLKKPDRPFTIGWIGSPITFKYLPRLVPVFEALAVKHRIKLAFIGSGRGLGLPNMEEEIIPWSEETEVSGIQKFDVGIMPLEDDYWERGKCGYKLIQYMGCGIPVIGSPVGVNEQIIKDGINGFKAGSLSEWEQRLEYLISNRHKAEEMGERGREIVTKDYSLQAFLKQWIGLLEKSFK
ncbi:MAG: glycosyltransferase [Cyclobacteriaceae bacterium]|nr:glycosyltransferase [Cyclobacteriaceae bacterium]